ncbi:MAG: hypothetical protein ACTSXT_10015 [Candidatus Helarchaeota archaeon]
MESEIGESIPKKPGKIKRFGRFLSKVGKKVLPAVADIATGVFIGTAAAPITQFIASKLTNYGISIDEAELTTLPESFSNLKSLQTLNLRYNRLDTLPESLCNLPNLKEIMITKNMLGTQANSIIKKCKKKGIKINDPDERY